MTAAFLLALTAAVWFAIGWVRAAGENARRERYTLIVWGGADMFAPRRRQIVNEARRSGDWSPLLKKTRPN
jgi:hypothetical protein